MVVDEAVRQAQDQIFAKETEQDLVIRELLQRVARMESHVISHMQMKHRNWIFKETPWWKFWDKTPAWVRTYLSSPACEDLEDGD